MRSTARFRRQKVRSRRVVRARIASAQEVAMNSDLKHGRSGEMTADPSSFTRCLLAVTGKFTSGRNRTCDIFGAPFVTRQTQPAGGIHNEEAVSRASCVHVPKQRLGETHVPERFSSKTRKNASGCSDDPLCTLLVAETR